MNNIEWSIITRIIEAESTLIANTNEGSNFQLHVLSSILQSSHSSMLNFQIVWRVKVVKEKFSFRLWICRDFAAQSNACLLKKNNACLLFSRCRQHLTNNSLTRLKINNIMNTNIWSNFVIYAIYPILFIICERLKFDTIQINMIRDLSP